MAKKRVLIIDDDALSRAIIRDLLDAAGYDPDEAVDGPEGLAKVESFRPDVILLDVLMPGLDGYEVCQRLKENPPTSHIAVIFVTAMKDEGVKQLAIETGAAAYITKPLRLEMLAATIEAALAKVDRQPEGKRKGGETGDRPQGERVAAMTSETPDLNTLAFRLDAIADRLEKLEVQVRALVTSQTVEAREFMVQDDRGEIRARLEMQEYAPSLIFYDRLGNERLRIGLRTDGSPSFQVGGREIPLPEG